MKYMVFSDVHGNLPALELALKDAGQVDGYICLGDTVDYGPWSNECVDRVLGLPNVTYIRGNHEEDFLKGSHTGDNKVANAFFAVCLPKFDRMEQIKNLPETYELGGFVFRHTIENRNIYPDSDVTLDNNYVIGHSHHQFWLEQPPFRLYNTGSIGQNRKYLNIINYLIFTPGEKAEDAQFELRALTYDPQIVLDEMHKQGYPEPCLEYYEGKARYTGQPVPPSKPATIL
ncbi:MAG TPA: metallophosphoesterase family protein [Candidatus Saccharimonadales bacterium]|nr:metallophosphoesterase family protein [Candidatus Saccharimonadales bacterium]